MSRKRRRGKSGAASHKTSRTSIPPAGTEAEPTPTETAGIEEAAARTPRQQRRAERIEKRRTTRRSTPDRNKGIRPWILPGFFGISIVAVVLVGISAVGDDGASAGANVPSPVLGEPTAQVAIHEYGDFQCPFCGVFSRSIKPELKEKYFDTGVARLVWHDFSWHGPESDAAANAARCAGEQDAFWDYHDVLFVNQRGDNQGAFSNDNLKFFGEQLGLDTEPFHECVDSNRYRDAIAADMARVRRLGLNGTPSFIIGDRRIIGAQPVEVFEQAIEAELVRAG